MAKSTAYPEIDQTTFLDSFVKLQKYWNLTFAGTELQLNIPRAQLEVVFINATRHDGRRSRSLCRGEYMDMILRLTGVIRREKKDVKTGMQAAPA